VQPGDAGTFHWLSQVAGCFEQYKIISVAFRFIPACATTQVGTVAMMWDPDPFDAAPTSMADVTAAHKATSGPAWNSLKLELDPHQIHRTYDRLYTRIHAIQSLGPELRQTDAGTLHVCYEDADDAKLFGRVFIEYTVALYAPAPRSEAMLTWEVQTTSATAGDLSGDIATTTNSTQEGTPVLYYEDSTTKWGVTGDYLVTIYAQGSAGMTNINTTACGTSKTEVFDVCKGATDSTMCAVACRVELGDTFKPTMAGATLTAVTFTFSPCVYRFIEEFHA
jgi:hypothetical protein